MTLDNWNKNWQINSAFLKQNFIMLATFGKKVIWRQQWCCWQCYNGVIKDISDRIFIKATNFILLVIFHESNWSRKPPIGHHWIINIQKLSITQFDPLIRPKHLCQSQSMSTFCRRQINMSTNQQSHAVIRWITQF